jgi:hypothetical protein
MQRISSPSPRRGEGWGEGERARASVRPWGFSSGVEPPHPALSPPGRGLVAAVSGVEQFESDRLEHALGARKHVVVPEADYPIAECFDHLRARRVDLGRVLSAVELDRKVCVTAGEVGDVRTDRKLADELRAFEPAGAEMMPQASFGVRASTPKVPSDWSQTLLCHCRAPSPQPSPRRGEGVCSAPLRSTASFPQPREATLPSRAGEAAPRLQEFHVHA